MSPADIEGFRGWSPDLNRSVDPVPIPPEETGRSFNGAATMVSRKTSASLEAWSGSLSFNGAATMVSRKTRKRRPQRRSRRTSFNGAATMAPRKTLRHRRRHVRPEPASMGPRRWCRGRPRTGQLQRLWNELLQWGRDDGVAEDVGLAVVIGRTVAASMGPRRSCRGRHTEFRGAPLIH
jgi:hypothetical protein